MCGFIGFSSSKNYKKYKRRLKKASDFLIHRGPDADGSFFSKNLKVGFAHKRLSIIDIDPRSNQPLSSECGRYSIVYNGEIYNFQSIRSDLIKKGYKFKTCSDTEVLLNAYIEYGKDVLLIINGMFAFAIYDSKEDSLFVARDRFGIKPLYYFLDDSEILFSSEIKPLNYLIAKKNKINEMALYLHTKYLFNPSDETIFSDIKKLPPGSLIITVNNKCMIEKWYQPSFQKEKNLNKNEVYEKFEKLLKKSVHSQLNSDAKLGAFLSGGLDSSSIVYFMREELENFPIYSIDTNFSNEDGFENDLFFAEKLAKDFKLDLKVLKIQPIDMINGLEQIVNIIEEPLADPAALNTYHICKEAKSDGVKVLLSGTGGDDILGGYRRHFSMKYLDKFTYLLKHINFKKIFLLKNSSPLLRRIEKLQKIYNLDVNQRIVNYLNWVDDDDLVTYFNDDSFITKENILKDYLKQEFSKACPLDKQLALEQRFFLNDHNLLYTDRMSMANNIEVRVPFLDHELVNFTNSIDQNFKIKNFNMKHILKEVMLNKLPSYIINRKKTGFGLPIRKWIKKELRPIIEDFLSEKAIKEQRIFNYKQIKFILRENQLEHKDYSYLIFNLLFFQIWYRNFIK